jgi:hypothetical protein
MNTYTGGYGRNSPAVWTSWLNLVLGIWTILAAFAFGFAATPGTGLPHYERLTM